MSAGCPVSLNHTSGPSGYLAWHEWAEAMTETHTQSRCPSCGLYVIWTPRPAADGSEQST